MDSIDIVDPEAEKRKKQAEKNKPKIVDHIFDQAPQ